MTVAALRLAPEGIVERGHRRLAFGALGSAAAMLVAGALLRDAPLAVRFVVPLGVFAVASWSWPCRCSIATWECIPI
jgi:hypothetical protein